MKAVRVNEWGKPVNLEDIPQPTPKDDEVLVRVRAASINPFDSAVMAGYLAFMASTPLTLGTDFAGEVIAAGPGITAFVPGDSVYGLEVLGNGTFAEYTIAKVDHISCKPESLDYIQASALPLAAMAAWQSLFEKGCFQSGERVLIHGVAGNVGSLALQLVKDLGGFVYGTDIPEKAGHAQALGIDRFIDTSTEHFEDVVKDVDLVLDYVGGEYFDRSLDVLKPGGRYVTSMLLDPPQDKAQQLGIRCMGLGSQPKADLLAQVAEMVDEGKLKVYVNCTFPLDDVQAAMDYRLQTKAPGKVVLTIS